MVGIECLLDLFSEPEPEQVDVARGVAFVVLAVDEGDVRPVDAEVVLDLEAVVVAALVPVAKKDEFGFV